MLRCTCIALALAGCQIVFKLDEPPLSCPRLYVPTGDSQYRLGQDSLNFIDAEAACEADHGADGSNGSTHLVVLGSQEELDAMINIAGDSEFLLGFTDQGTEGSFHWITVEDRNIDFAKAPMVAPWDSGEPNNANGENCVTRKGNHLLADTTCTDRTFRYVCECDTHEIDSPF